MEEQKNMSAGMWAEKDPRGRVRKALAFFLIIVSIFFIAKTINEFRSGALIGRSGAATNLISVSGKGEVLAVPDIATFTYSVTEDNAKVADAQSAATDKSNKVLDYLKSQKIDEKDIQTTNYSINPKYEYQPIVCVQAYNCPPSKQVLTGYEVSQSVEVKVRNIDQAGTILAGIGSFGVQNVSGLSLSVDKQDDLTKDARTKAIADARADADRIAKDLGVSIVRVVSFSENGSAPTPIYYDKAMALSAGGTAAPAPEISAGQDTITSNVSITYEIR